MKKHNWRVVSEMSVIGIALVALLMGVPLSCGGDSNGDNDGNGDVTEQDFCSVMCAKWDECYDPPFFPYQSVSECVTECMMDDDPGDDAGSGDEDPDDPTECEPPPTDAEVRACLDAIAAQSCDDFLSVEPPECASLCPDDSADEGGEDMGVDVHVDVPYDTPVDTHADTIPDMTGDCTSGNGAVAGDYHVAFTDTSIDTCMLEDLFGLPSMTAATISDDGEGNTTCTLMVLDGVPEAELQGTVSGAVFDLATAEPITVDGPMARCDYALTVEVDGTYGDDLLCGTLGATVEISGTACTLDGTNCQLERTFAGYRTNE